MTFTETLEVQPLSSALSADLRAIVDGKAKPKQSLGRIEDLAIQIGMIRNTVTPRIDKPALLVFAGDHGMTQSGVAGFPAEVTVAMVDLLLSGRASANAFAKVVGASVQVIDAGIKCDMTARKELIHAKVALGTKDACIEPAMTPEQAEQAITSGARIAQNAINAGADLIILGEMGIGNSSSASLIIHRLTNAPLHLCVGPGAGHSAEGMKAKREALERASVRTTANNPLDVLTEFGGFEIAMIAGAVMGAAKAGAPVLIDGLICSAAALVAIQMVPSLKDYCVFTHASVEPGHEITMTALKINPLLRLDMRLGEGTGALLAVPLMQAACALLSDVAALSDVMAAHQ